MVLLIIFISIIIFIKTTSYGIYEFRNNNKFGGIVVIFVSTLGFLLPNIVIYFRGF